ncbi:DinB family protein [Cesiribacter sp. SM1]|uniref:DinB family protein n=1 Tax=Cesiribacter sp. SM1 TaxID=2861196 RepID=UPI001CD207CD|nr:DinB family protein [Cesiribacter sp. SM1]
MDKHADKKLREQLVKHLKGGEAFMTVDEAVNKIEYQQLGSVPNGLPYSFYQLFYHMRLAQHDIIQFSQDPEYESPKWPEGYWPQEKAPQSPEAWQQLKEDYFRERDEFCQYLLNPANDLFEPFSFGSGQTLLREAMLIIEHNAYHNGQLLVVLRLLGLHG